MKNTKHIRDFIREHKGVSGVYAIVCTKTWRSYVGSSVDVAYRTASHFSALRNQRHANSDLQLSFNDHKINSFKCEILIKCPHDQLIEQENSFKDSGCNLYNMQNNFRDINLKSINMKRYLSFIDKTDTCWNWTGRLDRDGYGLYSTYKANRVAYFVANPNEKQSVLVRHKCHNRKCVNPNHLIGGSFHDNSTDTSYQGDSYKSNFVLACLIRNITRAQIKYHNGKNILEIVKQYYDLELSNSSFSSILNNKIYYDKNWTFDGLGNGGKKLSWDKVNWIRKSYNGSYKDIHEQCKNKGIDISYDQIVHVINNEQWIDPNHTLEITNSYNVPWSIEQEEWLKNNYLKYTQKDISLKLNRTIKSIKHRCKKLNLRKV